MHQQLQYLANSVNPLLALALIVLPLSWHLDNRTQFWLRSGLSLILALLVAKAIRHQHVLSERFPSTHFAFTLCAVTSLLLVRPRTWPLWTVVALAYGGLMAYQGYHTPLEMAGALYAVPLCWLVHRVFVAQPQDMPRAGGAGL